MQFIKKHKIASWLFDEITDKKGNIPEAIHQLPIHSITPSPYQMRKNFDTEQLSELAHSIKKYGVIQPVTVRKLPGGTYELIAGERRLRACNLAGMLKVPAIVVEMSDNDCAIVSLVENIHRESLDFMEEAEAYRNLLYHHGLTQEELANCLGKTQSAVANKLRLLKLSKVIREIIKDNSLTERHARALVRLETEEEQIQALEKICDRKLNVQQSDELIESMIEDKKPKLRPVAVANIAHEAIKDMRLFTNTIRHAIDLMHRHGIEAVSTETEYDDCIQYIITVSKEASSEKIS